MFYFPLRSSIHLDWNLSEICWVCNIVSMNTEGSSQDSKTQYSHVCKKYSPLCWLFFVLVWFGLGFFFVHLTQAKVIGKRGPQLRPCLHLIGWDGLENHEIYAAVFLKLKMLSGRPYLCLACFNSFFLLIVLPHLSLTSHVWVPSRAHSISIIVGITGTW